MKDGTENRLKFKQLQRRLGLTLWQVNGLLETLWRFVRLNAPRGDIGRFSNEEIAIGIDWEDDHDALVTTLVETKWLDASEEHRLVVHDWWDHCEDSVHTALAKKIDTFADGRFPKLTRITKTDRNAIERRYKQKYSKEELENGRAFQNALERSETPENACLAKAKPSQTKPYQGQGQYEDSSPSPVDFCPDSEEQAETKSELPEQDTSTVDWGKVEYEALRISKVVPPTNASHVKFYMRLAVACQLVFGDGFIPDALQAVKANKSRAGPQRHFSGVVSGKAEEEFSIPDVYAFLRCYRKLDHDTFKAIKEQTSVT